MKKKIKISHDDGPMEAMDMVTELLSEFGIPYEEVEGDGEITIEYAVPQQYTHSSRLEKAIYEKWAVAGFISGLGEQEGRLLSEIFEGLAVHLLINPHWNDKPWQTMIFPVIRKVFNNINHTNRINLNISEFVDKFIELHDNRYEIFDNISGSDLDVEAQFASLISERLVKEFKDVG
jgi:hypothetical protein